MELTDLYRQIKNPIDDPRVLQMLVDAYAESSKYGTFYTSLTKRQQKENVGKHYVDDYDKFYSMMFNDWKNAITSMSRERYEHLRRLGKCQPDFVKLRNFLKTVPDVKTKNEVTSIIFSDHKDQELSEALYKYRWDYIGEGSGWEHVHSRYADIEKRDVYEEVEHRLYLNTDPLDTLKMATLMVQKFKEKDLPYYFKFSPSGGRDDTIVLYTPTDKLDIYANLLREIVRDNPDIASRMQRPPVLNGLIEPWMGYGSEPTEDEFGKKRSFNSVRAPLIEKAIAKTTKKWMTENVNKYIDYKGQKITVQQYFSIGLYTVMMKELQKRYEYKLNGESEESFAKRRGYYGSDLKSETFRKLIYNFVQSKSDILLNFYLKGESVDEKMSVPARFGKEITLEPRFFKETIQKMARYISTTDPMFIQQIGEEIRQTAKENGIDPDKYCFDQRAVLQLKKEDQRRKQNPIAEVQTPINMDKVTAENFPKMINPELINKEVKAPNGQMMEASLYLQNIVFPHMPENGVIVLKNGSAISVKQFVEEGILGECQTKYNGNFYQYLLEKTKNNFGVLKLKGKYDEVEIETKDLSSYIDPETLQQRITQPNGSSLDAKTCIESMYLDYVPYTGRVTLTTGQSISVKQYIEEVLIPETQNKYNGYLGSTIIATTRANSGTIDMNPKHLDHNRQEMKPGDSGNPLRPYGK